MFTAPADVLAGAALVTVAGYDVPWQRLASLVVASAAIYCAGMAANDLFDARIDAEERPGRPIPSGRIRVGEAWALVVGLQVLGLAIAAGISATAAAAVAGTIAATYLYNGGLKRGALGPFSMGLCRFGNGMVGLAAGGMTLTALTELPMVAFAAPAGVGLYVAAVTGISRFEVGGGRTTPVRLALGATMILAALVALWPALGLLPVRWAALAGVLPIVWLAKPLSRAWTAPSPKHLKGAVMAGVFGIAIVNGVLAFAAGQPVYGVIAIGLLVPGRFVGRWFYAT